MRFEPRHEPTTMQLGLFFVSDVGAKLRSNNNNNNNNHNNDDNNNNNNNNNNNHNNNNNDNSYSKATMSATTMTRAPSTVATTITTTTTATRERTTMFLSCQHSPLRRPLFLSFQIQINTKKLLLILFNSLLWLWRIFL